MSGFGIRSPPTIARLPVMLDSLGCNNGELLAPAESAGFDVFLTVDQGIEYQQNLTRRKIAILILRPKSNRLKDLLSLLPKCLAQIDSVRPGQICKIDA